MQDRLVQAGATWDGVAAAVLTHTHGDHVQADTLRWFAKQRIALFCHEGHGAVLDAARGFRTLARMGLVHRFDDRPFLVPPGFRVEAIPLSHDGGPTFGFRVEGRAGRRGRLSAVGYVTDTGLWTAQTADALTDVDLLGVEFNHDVELQRRSGRPHSLIAQRAGGLRPPLQRTGGGPGSRRAATLDPGRTRQLVLLHLSQQCNRPELALSVARTAVRQSGHRLTVHAARQDQASPDLHVPRRATRSRAAAVNGFPWEQAHPRPRIPRNPVPATYFASDIHLRPDRSERGRRFARLVGDLSREDHLVLAGDICDFWFASRRRRGTSGDVPA